MERTLRYSPRTRRIGGLLAALVCAVALSGCDDDDSPTPSTVGSLNVNVNPWSATVVVTGPQSFTETFIGNQLLTDLTPGSYTASATAPGFVGASSSINVVAGNTSSISLILQPIDSDVPRAVYRDGDGNLVPLDPGSLQAGSFVFYAWLKDEPLGILAAALNSTILDDPGKPLITEQWESAPSFTQNVAAAWVGFMDATGVVRPVIGADVRWEIDQWWEGRINSMQYGTSDDNRVALGYGVFDDQADTRTNNARLGGERFPFLLSEYPLYNATGVGSPFTDGFTWVTLFSPDAMAQGRIVAVATIDGEEIGKQILYKSFAPAPEIVIAKTVDVDLINLDDTDTVTWTVTVTNVGTGDATTVSLADFLSSENGANYTLGSLPPGCTTDGADGFDCDLAIPAATDPTPPGYLLGSAESFAVLANATVTNTGSSVVTGDVGVSAGSAVTGFPPGLVESGTIHNNDAAAQAAQTALTAAYVDLGARVCNKPVNTPLSDATLGPGVYCYDSSAALTGPLVLDAGGDPDAEFVFKIGTTLTTAAASSVSLVNGASPCNVYWQLGSSATLLAGSDFAGNILAQSDITAVTGSSISGRALARVGTVSLDATDVTAPLSCAAVPPPPGANTVTLTFTATVNAPGIYCNEALIFSYSSETDTWTPVDLNDEACFTAVESVLTIVKDFVADDGTSLGQSRTVSASVPARLRVRVLNSGGADATGVTVNDVLDGGALAAYEVISVSSGTLNGEDGFDTAAFDVPAGETVTLLFEVRASVDGTYCDTATVLDDAGAPIDDDSACLIVATPELVITKIDSPVSVFPGASYTSTIVVTNIGNAIAKDVVVRDLLGSLDSAGAVWVDYVSSSQGGAGGTLANHFVTAPVVVDLAPDQTMTFTVVSRMPLGAVSGEYCDTATVTSSNAVTQEATDCVDVPAFSALQTQLVDLADPVAVGSEVAYFSVLYVESLSNEGVGQNVLTYSFGLASPLDIGDPGEFDVVSTQVYLDSAPVRDPATGLVVSDATSPTAELQTLGTDYTLSAAQTGFQVITMTAGVVLQPDTALYIVHVVRVPAGTAANRLYTTSYIWDSVGLIGSVQRQASSSEPTTVLP